MFDGRNTLWNNDVDEEEEAKDDEEKLPSTLYQKDLGELKYILRNDD